MAKSLRLATRNSLNDDMALVRYLPDGTIDTHFGNDGQVITDLGGEDVATSIAVQVDGKIVVAGKSAVNGIGAFVLLRYSPDGTLDGSFGQDGRIVTDFGSGDSAATGVVVQSDGKIVAGGYGGANQPTFALARFNSDGTPDGTFDGDGKELITVGTEGGRPNGLAIGLDGRIVMAGYVDIVIGQQFAVARLRGDNRTPVPVPTTMNVIENSTFTVTNPAYFYDPDGDVATTELLYGPAHGTLSLTPYGTFTYAPAPDFSGTDVFAYKVSDAFGGFNVGSVELNVTPDPHVEVRADLLLPGKQSLFVRGTVGNDMIVIRPVGTSTTKYSIVRNGGTGRNRQRCHRPYLREWTGRQ